MFNIEKLELIGSNIKNYPAVHLKLGLVGRGECMAAGLRPLTYFDIFASVADGYHHHLYSHA